MIRNHLYKYYHISITKKIKLTGTAMCEYERAEPRITFLKF